MSYRHIVLFRVFDDVTDARVSQALAELRSLASLDCVQSWHVEVSLDTRKGRVIVEDATFADAAAFEEFRADPSHVRVAAGMSEIADWWNGDYVS